MTVRGTDDSIAARALGRAMRATPDPGRWFALCGTRLYCVETLGGTFPDTGWHQPEEMGGVWAPPIKLLDGYWIGLRARGGEEPLWLRTPVSWAMAADGATLTYEVPELAVRVRRRAWIVPDESVLVVEVFLTHPDSETPVGPERGLECGIAVRSDLHGAWLSAERLGMGDGADVARFNASLGAIELSDTLHPDWRACVGATAPPVEHAAGSDVWGPERTTGNGVGAVLWYHVGAVAAGEPHLRAVIAGASDPAESATALFRRYAGPWPERTPTGHTRALRTAAPARTPLRRAHQRAIARYREPFEVCVLRSPDALLNEAFAWAKHASAALVVEVPGLGRAPMAGMPDFPWWFGADIAYGALPMLPMGQGAVAAAALRTLAAISRQHKWNGAVAHEIVTNGVVAAPGTLVEVPLFARALYHVYRWTGDRELLDELLPFCLEGLLGYALGSCLEAGEQVPQGRSMVETPDMHGDVQTLDVGAYLAEALELMSELAGEIAWDTLAAALWTRALAVRAHMRDAWWLDREGLFGDMRASRRELEELLRRFEGMAEPDDSVLLSIARLREALAGDPSPGEAATRRPWLLYYYIQVLAAEAGLPTPEQAARLLDRMESPEWVEEFGLVLNAATDRRVMTLPTGALAVAEARYGRADAALRAIERIVATFGAASPGTMSEYSPDGGCFLQLWSNYGVMWPLVNYVFGLRPDAATRRLRCAPQLPAAWPSAELRSIPLGDTRVDVSLAALPDGLRVVLEIADPTWTVELGVAVPREAQDIRLRVDGELVSAQPMRQAAGDDRSVWLAPCVTGRTTYELTASWSLDADQFALTSPVAAQLDHDHRSR